MGSVTPAEEGRTIFGGHFYRMLSPDNEDFLISPGAVLKLLMTLSLGANISLADQMLWDLYIKHVDERRLQEEANREGIWDMGYSLEIRERLELELKDYIERKVLLDFFENDFTELYDSVTIKNYIVADGTLRFQEDYRNLMADYFKTMLINRNQPKEMQCIEKKFENLSSGKSVDVYGSVSFVFEFGTPFTMNDDGSFEAFGSFKYNEIKNNNSMDFRAQVLEIPLNCNSTIPLQMLIFIPNCFRTLLKQSIGRDYSDFNKISAKLTRKLVKVKLPKINAERITELASFLAETSYRGLRNFLKEPIILDRMFENAEETEVNFGNYWQHTSLEMVAPRANVADQQQSSLEPDCVFDATNKSFLYVIRSSSVQYVIGHYYKGK